MEMDVKDRLFEARLRGLCCSESIMAVALEEMGRGGEEAQSLVKAMGAFCGGLHVGRACGALCAACAVLWLAADSPAQAHDELGPEMMDWFKEHFGSWDCDDLLEGDETRHMTLCPNIIDDTYFKLREMLEDLGAVE
jgi:C_GCAxxG_C_C family probable redox protein